MQSRDKGLRRVSRLERITGPAGENAIYLGPREPVPTLSEILQRIRDIIEEDDDFCSQKTG